MDKLFCFPDTLFCFLDTLFCFLNTLFYILDTLFYIPHIHFCFMNSIFTRPYRARQRSYRGYSKVRTRTAPRGVLCS